MADNASDPSGKQRAWAPEIWLWSPAEGKWTPDAGAPRKSVQLSMTSQEVAPHQRYDAWTNVAFYDFEPDAPNDTQRLDFQADATGTVTPTGTLFRYRSEAISGSRPSTGALSSAHDDIAIGLILTGQRQHTTSTGVVLTAGPNEFFVYDPTRPSRVAWRSSHVAIALTLRRNALVEAFNGDVPAEERIVEALHKSRLAPFLRAQLQLLAEYIDQMSATEKGMVFGSVADLTLGALRSVYQEHGACDAPMARRALFVAATRYIDAHLNDMTLDADAVAHGIHCSRATLYRCFADRDLTVAGAIRMARVERIGKLLQTAPSRTPIATLALSNGFIDLRTFNRQFAKRFGMTPGEFRRSPLRHARSALAESDPD
ncbi:helix-turn-helix domain-containing protein [Agrobacterium tumefaciens]|uniref:helix-turn-helix domain-containing protein n=1 Tax=Agrobacterium tumefaciens TaxID=358 RepID=UPI00157288CC|nr:helix-turn-helix domain-containing protein [Agrobacterium tumefaciens]